MTPDFYFFYLFILPLQLNHSSLVCKPKLFNIYTLPHLLSLEILSSPVKSLSQLYSEVLKKLLKRFYRHMNTWWLIYTS